MNDTRHIGEHVDVDLSFETPGWQPGDLDTGILLSKDETGIWLRTNKNEETFYAWCVIHRIRASANDEAR